MTPNQLDLLWRFVFVAITCTGIGWWSGYRWRRIDDQKD